MSHSKAKLSWLQLALKQLVKKGPNALTIDQLCQTKKVTKGSFYHHFNNRSIFIQELMDYWYEQTTQGFIKAAETQQTPLEKLQKLDQIIAGHNIEAENHLRAWALKEPVIESHLEKIDNQRRDYLSQCYQQMGANKTQADDIALMVYSSFLGLQQVRPKPDIHTALHICSMGSKAILSIEA